MHTCMPTSSRWGESNYILKLFKYRILSLFVLTRGPTRGPKNKTVYMNFNQLVLGIAQQLTGPQFVPIDAPVLELVAPGQL